MQKFGLSNNNNNNHEKNKKLAEQINKLISQPMQQQILTAINEYKEEGDLILFFGEHKIQFSENKKSFDKERYIKEDFLETSQDLKPWKIFAGFICLLMKDHSNVVITKEVVKKSKEKEVVYSLLVGIKANAVLNFKEKWNEFYNNGNFNYDYLEVLASQSLTADPGSGTNMNP